MEFLKKVNELQVHYRIIIPVCQDILVKVQKPVRSASRTLRGDLKADESSDWEYRISCGVHPEIAFCSMNIQPAHDGSTIISNLLSLSSRLNGSGGRRSSRSGGQRPGKPPPPLGLSNERKPVCPGDRPGPGWQVRESS